MRVGNLFAANVCLGLLLLLRGTPAPRGRVGGSEHVALVVSLDRDPVDASLVAAEAAARRGREQAGVVTVVEPALRRVHGVTQQPGVSQDVSASPREGSRASTCACARVCAHVCMRACVRARVCRSSNASEGDKVKSKTQHASMGAPFSRAHKRADAHLKVWLSRSPLVEAEVVRVSVFYAHILPHIQYCRYALPNVCDARTRTRTHAHAHAHTHMHAHAHAPS